MSYGLDQALRSLAEALTAYVKLLIKEKEHAG